MRADQLLIAHLSASLLLLLLLGLLVRRRYRLCWAFLLHCATALTVNRLITWWPSTFYTSRFWPIKETVYDVLTTAVLIEIGWLTFSQFPRARRRLVWLCSAVVIVTLAARFAAHHSAAGQADWYRLSYSVLIPLGRAGTLWVCVAMLAVAAWHRVPLHPFHQAVLVGFMLYIGVVTMSFVLVGHFGWSAYAYSAAFEQIGYTATVGLWTWGAWRRLAALSPIRRELQPWAVSSR